MVILTDCDTYSVALIALSPRYFSYGKRIETLNVQWIIQLRNYEGQVDHFWFLSLDESDILYSPSK